MRSPSQPKATPPSGLTTEHVFLTGATGFVGQAILERLLSSHPGTRISILVRGKGSQTGDGRLANLMRKPVFASWIESVGEESAREQIARRITVIQGSLGHVGTLPKDIDVVIHGASTVSSTGAAPTHRGARARTAALAAAKSSFMALEGTS